MPLIHDVAELARSTNFDLSRERMLELIRNTYSSVTFLPHSMQFGILQLSYFYSDFSLGKFKYTIYSILYT